MTSKSKTKKPYSTPHLIVVNQKAFQQLKKNFPPGWIEVVHNLPKPKETRGTVLRHQKDNKN